MSRPDLTVIVPALNAVSTLRACLEGLTASDLPRERFELMLVDDGSTDETSLVGAEYCDTVIRLAGRPHGPAFARNRGVEQARGDIVVFVDADVVVHPDALRRLVERFASAPDVSAVFGSYDARPAARSLVSRYRNLLHHYVHQKGRGDAETFWAGLGAVRRADFLEVGMFDEWHYNRPQIEDIELGRRLRRYGHRLLLDPDIQGTHLKRWTLGSTLRGDFQHRGVPWMWLLLQEGSPGTTTSLNVRTLEKVLTGLTALALLTPIAALALGEARVLLAGAALLASVSAANIGFYLFLLRRGGPLLAAAAVPLHLAYYAGNAFSVVSGWFVNLLFGEPVPPAEIAAHAQIGIATWPPAPRRSAQSIWEQPRGGPDGS